MLDPSHGGQRTYYILHLKGAFPLLCFWPSVRICEILKASKPKRPENAFSMYVSRRYLITPWAFSIRKDVTKIVKRCLVWQCVAYYLRFINTNGWFWVLIINEFSWIIFVCSCFFSVSLPTPILCSVCAWAKWRTVACYASAALKPN